MSKVKDFSKLALDVPTTTRPSLTNQQSNSLPSTPYQHTRSLSFRSRSPSPEQVDGNESPRSVKSELDSGVRSRAKGPLVAGCIYETGMAFSRRRVPYSIGGDQLERPTKIPKKYLTPVEEGKLSGDMRELYDRILPRRENDVKRAKFVQKLERILNDQWPGNNIKVHVFGSSGNMLYTSDSDMDICITTPMKALERVCLLAKALAEHGMERVICVSHAKVPIVKVWDPELEIACDMNVNNTLALENTRMIKTYVDIDERVRPLAMIIKYWTKRRVLNDAALGGTLSSYTWICMILSFLQTRSPPILPCLHRRPHQRLIGPDGQPSSFADDMVSLHGFGHKNTETLGDLLFHFFRQYGYEIDYEKNVVSIREGHLISKEVKRWHLMQNNRLCVEEPFNTERNLGNTVDDISFRGVHLELRRAFNLISEAKLDECVEQYAFPALEEKIWEKPPPKPPPILSRSRSQSQNGRGGKTGTSNRGSRPSQHQHRPVQQGRRASSAAAHNRFVGLPPGVHGTVNQDHPARAQYEQLQLHDQLFNEYQLLQAQEHELRLLQVQAQLHAQVQAQSSQAVASIAQQASRENFNRSSMISQAPLSAPLRSGNFPHPFSYPPVHGPPYQSLHTNPSSPSIHPVLPELRRSVHRSSAESDASSSSLRSHSQPARPLPFGIAVQNLQGLPYSRNGFLHYQQLYQQHLYNSMEVNHNHPRSTEHSQRRPPLGDPQFEENLPKEYVGYYVHDSPPTRFYRDDPAIARMPVYNDLPHRLRGFAPGFSRLRIGSRSPSPSTSIPSRDRSFSVRSAASAPPGPVHHEKVQVSASGLRSSGPIIVNGSDTWGQADYCTVADSPSHTTTISEATSGSDEQLYDTPISLMDISCQGVVRQEPHVLDGSQQTPHAHTSPYMYHIMDSGGDVNTDSFARYSKNQINDAVTMPERAKAAEVISKSGNGLGIQYDNNIAKRQSSDPDALLSQESNRKTGPVQKLDIAQDSLGFQNEKPQQGTSLLSPVREVRTPSPTTSRRSNGVPLTQYPGQFTGPMQLHIPPYQNGANGKWKQTETSAQRTHGVSSKSGESPKASLQPVSNGWQQPTKKGKKNKSKGSVSQVPNGEPLPVNEAERKGG